MVEDALERMTVESEWHREQDAERARRQAYQRTGGEPLDVRFPEMEA